MNATAASLLGLLDQSGEVTGAELARMGRQRIGDFWSLTRSQVYRELPSLERDGYVQAGPPGPREARPYRLTTQGRQAFLEWLAGEQPRETIRIPLLLAVAFGRSLPPGRLDALLDGAEATHHERLAAYRQLDEELVGAGVDEHTRATLSFGIHYETAVLTWLSDLPPSVRPGGPQH